MSETEAEGVVDIGTEDISEYEKIRAVNVEQKEKLLRKLKRDWEGFKEGEGFVTGGRRKKAKKLKIVEKEALNRGSEGGDQQSGKITKQNLGSSGTGLDIWIWRQNLKKMQLAPPETKFVRNTSGTTG